MATIVGAVELVSVIRLSGGNYTSPFVTVCSNGFEFDGSHSQASISFRHCFNTSGGNELSNCSCWNVNSSLSAPASLIFRSRVAPEKKSKL